MFADEKDALGVDERPPARTAPEKEDSEDHYDDDDYVEEEYSEHQDG